MSIDLASVKSPAREVETGTILVVSFVSSLHKLKR